MNIAEVFPYLIAFFIGVATPILIVREVMRAQGDRDACVLSAILVVIAGVVLMLTLAWIRAS